MGIITIIYQNIMNHYIISIIIALSMVATPLLAADSLPLSCDDQKCCHAMAAHHDMADMVNETCQCQMSPLLPCHIAPDQHPPQLAIILSNDQDKFQDLLHMSALVETDPTELLSGVSTTTNQSLWPELHPPPTYLLTCTLII